MSKFSEALERVEMEERQASSLQTAVHLSGEPPAVPLGAKPSVFVAPARATARAVDRSQGVGAHLVSLLDPRSFAAEQYRELRHAVETLRKDANLQVVAVTSPGVGEGKTTTAINLAGALAQSADTRVLLVDIDLRRPTAARQLGLGSSKRSLMDALQDSGLTLDDTVEHLAQFNLSVLPAGTPGAAPYELIKSPRLETLLDEARRRYDYIVLDTPPFLPVPDCRVIAKHVDGFLTVVAAHQTPRGELARALDLMDPAKVVGLVFNGHHARRSSYYDVYAAPSPSPPRRRLWRRP